MSDEQKSCGTCNYKMRKNAYICVKCGSMQGQSGEMINCVTCGNKMSSKAQRCPNCNAWNKKALNLGANEKTNLVSCNNCSHQISDEAEYCPNCGLVPDEQYEAMNCVHCSAEFHIGCGVCPKCGMANFEVLKGFGKAAVKKMSIGCVVFTLLGILCSGLGDVVSCPGGSSTSPSGSSSTTSSSMSSADSEYIYCLCKGFNGVINLRGCRGNENTPQCARRECGKWDENLYQQALMTSGCGE